MDKDGVAFVEAGDDFVIFTIGEADFDGAVFLFAAGEHDGGDGGVAVFAGDGLGGDDEDVVFLGADNLEVGGHFGFEEGAIFAGDFDFDFEGDDVGGVDSLGGDADDFAVEMFAGEGVGGDEAGAVEVDLADVGFVDVGEDEDVGEVGEGHERGAAGEAAGAGSDDGADLDIECGDDAVHGGVNCGVVHLLLGVVESDLVGLDLGVGDGDVLLLDVETDLLGLDVFLLRFGGFDICFCLFGGGFSGIEVFLAG